MRSGIYTIIMKQDTLDTYKTIACVEWDCRRCGKDVLLDKNSNPYCDCKKGPSPWEQKRCLNGDGSSEFVLFRRRY